MLEAISSSDLSWALCMDVRTGALKVPMEAKDIGRRKRKREDK